MRDVYRILLTILTGLLALWLILEFWPLSVSSRVVLCLLVILVCGIVLYRQWVVPPRQQDIACNITDESLPPEDFQGRIILAGTVLACLSPARNTVKPVRAGICG